MNPDYRRYVITGPNPPSFGMINMNYGGPSERTWECHAKWFDITKQGDLMFYDEKEEIVMAFARGQWYRIEAADE